MASPETKAALERRRFEQFSSLSGLLRGAAVTSQSPPEPDLLAVHEQRRIGIEVTELHRDGPHAQATGEWKGILSAAAGLHKARDLPPVFVNVWWHEHLRPRKKLRDLAEPLANVVANNQSLNEGTVQLSGRIPELSVAGVHPIKQMWITRIPGHTTGSWDSMGSWTVHSDGWTVVSRAIKRKDSKVLGYTHSYDEVWLILAHSIGAPSGGFDLDISGTPEPIQSRFDAVFYLGGVGPKCLRVPTMP